jgi:hypothetical protein
VWDLKASTCERTNLREADPGATLARRTEASANHAICGNFHGPGIQCSGCPAERAISPVMYDLTLHIDRLIVCSLLRNAKNDRNFVLLGASTMQKEVAKELPAVISGCNIVPRPLHEYCVLCTEVCCDTSRAPDIGQGSWSWSALPCSHVVSLAAENRLFAEAQHPPH